ncbi:MAG: methyltransferase domain-containing protein [Pirellulales bacterium]|nr:methyltransferase domain-containing protein [Pirellulales bacterium]
MSSDAKRDAVVTAKAEYQAHLLQLNPGATSEAAYRGAAECYDAEIRPLLPDDPQAAIVEVGCGFGHLLRYLRRQGFSRVGGVELNEDLHRAAAEYAGSAAEFLVQADGLDFLQSRPGRFDVVVLYDVIEHFTLEEAALMFQVIRGSLRPGGRAIFRTPNMSSVLAAHSRYIDVTHQIGFTQFSLAQMLRQAGFEEVGVHVPVYSNLRARLRQKLYYAIHRFLYNLQNRVAPASFDANLVMWARKTLHAEGAANG